MAGKSIVMAGAGNIGSHFAENLARMNEVERVVIVDRDTYEERNVGNQRIVPRDIGKPKAMVQARRLLEIRPSLEVHAIHAALENLPLGAWRADLIVACLDSKAARQVVNERAWRLGLPWVDSGVMGQEWLARVNAYLPAVDAPCLECSWSEVDYKLLEQQYLCGNGNGEPPPNTASSELGALAAAMLSLECRKMLAGEMECAAVGRQATYNARWLKFAVSEFRRNTRCRFDRATWRIEPLRCDTRAMRLAGLLEMAPTVRVPGHRFVRRLVCPACCGEKRLFHLESSLDAVQRRCSACRRPMVTPGFDIVENLNRDLPADVRGQTLDEAGLRYGDVVQAGDGYFEITEKVVMRTGK
jgi:molybdopterin/thiamine biosynthesis adenylyltransferase